MWQLFCSAHCELPVQQVAMALMTQLSAQVFWTWLLCVICFVGVLTGCLCAGKLWISCSHFFLLTSLSPLDLLVHFLLSHPCIPISFVHSVSVCLLSWCLWQEWAVWCCPYPAGPASVAWPFELMYRNEQAWPQLEVPQL